MRNLTAKIIAFSLIFGAFSFTNETEYEKEISDWRAKRIENLKNENGWLNLAGLFWLEEGENTIGGDSKNSIIFPKEHSDAFLGKIYLQKSKITFIADDQANVLFENEKVKEVDIFPYEKKPIVLSHQSLKWFIIQRGDKYAIRLRDTQSPFLLDFKGIETFATNPKYKVKGKFIPTKGVKLTILDITGRSYEQDSPGKLEFEIEGNKYELTAVGTPEKLHFVFADHTSKHETYGGGRFLDADGPVVDGYVTLDFNKAYNPPCAFTPYATCPLPIEENKLKVGIRAGEKYLGEH